MFEKRYRDPGYPIFFERLNIHIKSEITDENELKSFLREKTIQYYEIITDGITGPNKSVYIDVKMGVRMPREGYFLLRN